MGIMTNLAKTLYGFFNQFGVAYVNNSVPSGTSYPYYTYSLETEEYFTSGILQVLAYSKSFSFVEITEMTDKITELLKDGYKLELVEGGYILMNLGSPSCQIISDIDDNSLKTALINIEYRIYQ